MNRKWIVVIAPLILAAGIWIGATMVMRADAADNVPQPGSVEDPVVTKSYVDQQIAQLVKEAMTKQQQDNTGNPAVNVPSLQGSSDMSTVVLKNGQSLYAGTGAEFIVRTGKAIAITTKENGIENGIPDMTAGKDILGGAPIGLNHLLVFPREGRGIKPATDNKDDIYVMVRGSYVLLNQDGTVVKPASP